MTALIIIVAVLALIVFLLLQFAGIRVIYDGDTRLFLEYSFLKIDLFRLIGKKKKKKSMKSSSPKKAGSPDADKDEEKGEIKKSLPDTKDIFTMAKTVKGLSKEFAEKLHFKSAKFHVTVGGEDAAKVAVTCGTYKMLASAIFEVIDNVAVLDRGPDKNVIIEPDFTSDATVFDVDITFRARLSHVLKVILKFFVGFIKAKIKEETKKTERKKT